MERIVEVRIGALVSKKRETHLASVVLESHKGKSKRFDIETRKHYRRER